MCLFLSKSLVIIYYICVEPCDNIVSNHQQSLTYTMQHLFYMTVWYIHRE